MVSVYARVPKIFFRSLILLVSKNVCAMLRILQKSIIITKQTIYVEVVIFNVNVMIQVVLNVIQK